MTDARVGPQAAAVLAIAMSLGPFASLVAASLGDPDGGTGLSLSSYRVVLEAPAFLRATANSLGVALLTTLLCLVVASPAAFALAQMPLRGRRLILGFAIATSMFPPIATVSPLYVALRAAGLRDSALALVFPYCALTLPLALFLLTGACREVPRELYDAARVDGCTPFGALRRVVLPLLAPAIATTGLLVFIAAWSEFLYALTFTSSPSERTLPVAIALLSSEHTEPWPEMAAASVMATMPLVLLTLVFQRRILDGVTAGAVKG